MECYLHIQHKGETNLSTEKIDGNTINEMRYALESARGKDYCIGVAYFVDGQIRYLKDPLTGFDITADFDENDKIHLGTYMNCVSGVLDKAGVDQVKAHLDKFIGGQIPQHKIKL